MNALNARNVRGNGLFSTLHTTKNCLMGLGVSLGIAIALPNSAEAAATAYGYAYQEIRGFSISGFDVDANNITLQPVTTSRGTLNSAINDGSDTNTLDVTPAISAVPSLMVEQQILVVLMPLFGFDNGTTLAPVADA